MPSRREFLHASLFITAGLGLPGVACTRRAPASGKPTQKEPSEDFPHLEAKGSAREVGRAIGERFSWNIQQVFARRRGWFDQLRAYAEEDPASRYEPFVQAAQELLPDCLEELRGMSEGAGVELRHLVILNLAAELDAMRKKPCGCPGCSTLALADGDRLLLAHNEDGDMAYRDLMFTVRVSRPGKPSFFALTYPGILPGNAPVFNSAGLAMTTNFIGGLMVRPGVGRYLLSRAMCEAADLDEAVRIASLPQRAYSFHFCVGSRKASKILSVETCPEKLEVMEVKNLYVHTNHLVLPGMRDVPQDAEYLEASSMSRYRVLSDMVEKLQGRLDGVDADRLVEMLSSHEGRPTAPCRHHQPPSRGVTLGCATYDLKAGVARLCKGNPCQGNFAKIRLG